MPALQKQGVDIDNEGAVQEALNRLYTRTVADLFGKMITQRLQYQSTQKKLGLAPGLDGASQLDTKDPFVALEGVTSQMVNTAAEISKPIIDTIIPALGGLSGSLNGLARTLRDNPDFAKEFGTVGAAAAGGGILGALFGGGRALLAGGGIGGGLAGALRWGALGSGGGLALAGIWSAMQFLSALRMGGAEGSKTTYGSALPGFAGEIDKSYQAQKEGRRDPEAFRGRAMMNIGAPIDVGSSAADGQATGSSFATGVANGISAQAPAVEAQGRSIMDRLRAVFSSGVSVNLSVSGGGGAPAGEGSAPARASGGSVAAGGLYRVNEFGEEFYQPTEDGRIIDPRRSAGGRAGSKSASLSMSNSFSISGVSDPAAVAEAVVHIVDQKVQELARAAFADMGVELA